MYTLGPFLQKRSHLCSYIFFILTFPTHPPMLSKMYTRSIIKLIASTAVISAAHYMVVFILLIVIYMKFFRIHQRQRCGLLGEGHPPQVSKKAAFCFLAVFAINGGTSTLCMCVCALVGSTPPPPPPPSTRH